MFTRYVCASLLVLGLAACSVDDKPAMGKADAKKAAPRVDVAAPKGLSQDVYFDDDIQVALASLRGMQRTLDRLENDLQSGAMQRIAAMREEITNTNQQLRDLQRSLRSAGAGKAAPLVAVPVATPQSITGEMGKPDPMPVVETVAAPVAAPVAVPVIEAPKAPAPKAAEAAKPAPVKAAPAKKASAAKSGVHGVRVGVHEDKVRVVLDVAGKAPKYTAHYDAGEKILTVELPDTPWSAALQQSFANNPSLSGFSAQKNDTGSVVVFALRDGVKLLDESMLAGTGGKDSRLILDMSR